MKRKGGFSPEEGRGEFQYGNGERERKKRIGG
jgi:hypothetical protein